jgi:hypothetical protein
MPRKRAVRKERGVFEKVVGSDIWWIRYKVEGVEHREKVGRFSDAVDLYRVRRVDALRGAKMPANMKNKGVKFQVTLSDLKIFSTPQLSLKRLSGKVVEESTWATRYSVCATYVSQHQQTVHVTARRVEHLQVGALWNWALISGITNRLLQWQRSVVSARLRRNFTSHNRH